MDCRYLCGFIFLLFTKIGHGQQLRINGKAEFFKDGTEISIQREYPLGSVYTYPNVIHKTTIQKGLFVFHIQASSQELYRLYVHKPNGVVLNTPIFLGPESCSINLRDSVLKNIGIEGSRAAKDFQEFSNYLASLKEEDEFSKAYGKSIRNGTFKDPEVRSTLDSLLFIRNKARSTASLEWIKGNINTPIKSYVLYKYLFDYMNEDGLKDLFHSMEKTKDISSWYKELRYCLFKLTKGSLAPEFQQKDTSGRKVSLSSFKGKYVLIDFWASWCIPCRKQSQVLIPLYLKYQNKDFAVIGVSLDDSKEAWKTAIIKDHLPWIQVSDLKGYNNRVAKQYNISSIPMNYLLNKEGKIIGKDLSGDDLVSEIEQLFH